jgi:glycosyltransferase involved in cell wall biosynthesis
MKIAFLTNFNKLNHGGLLQKYPNVLELDFSHQYQALQEFNYWSSAWHQSLSKLGYEVLLLPITNGGTIYQKWCAENGLTYVDDEETIIRMLNHHQPELLIYNHFFSRFINRIRKEVPSIKKVVSMLGSATVDWDLYKYTELSITCSLTFVAENAKHGVKSYRIHHAFDPATLLRLQNNPKNGKFVFIGSIQRRKHYHYYREKLLKLLVRHTPIEIYSPSIYFTWKDDAMTVLKQAVYLGLTPVRAIPTLYKQLNRIKKFEKILTLQDFPRFPVDWELKKVLRPAVFGDEMFQTLQDASLVFNVHLDGQTSSSNIRQFEVTGVGTCLLTDFKPDLPEIFIPDQEIVAYNTPEEAVEKARWLLEHPEERERIAQAGQQRTLRDHTFDKRAEELQALIKEKLDMY